MAHQKSLYIVLLGGKHPNARIEVHDMRPVITEQLAHAYSELKQQWFGLSKGLHIDGWMRVDTVLYQQQAYKIVIRDEQPKPNSLKLFLINLGAYLPDQFGEIHKYVVVAAYDATEAKLYGKQAIEQHWIKAHTDAVIDVDDCILLDLFNEHYVHLVETTQQPWVEFQNDYILI